MPQHGSRKDSRRSLSHRLNIVVYMLLVICLGVTCYMMFIMNPQVQKINGIRQQSSQAERQLWRVAYMTAKLSRCQDSERSSVMNALTSESEALTNNLSNLCEVAPIDLRHYPKQATEAWMQLKRNLDRAMLHTEPSHIGDFLNMDELERQVNSIQDLLGDTTSSLSQRTEAVSGNSGMLSTSVYVVIILLVAWVFMLIRNMTKRVYELLTIAQKIANGDYSVRANIGNDDELTDLAETFNTMASQIDERLRSEHAARLQLEEVIHALSETAESMATSTSDILTATTEQAAAMSEESAAIQQTSVTVEELKQVTAMSTQKAVMVANLAQQSEEVTQCGREAVERSIEGMIKIRDEVQSLATSMSRLSEQTQAVGEIISTVQDIAEQSNMLAVNAAIEAARAGEHGYGFSVVANEVRVLAEQSRQATVQVRSILGEIQKGVTTALNNTETESKSVEEGVELANQAGEVIRSLTETISHSSNAANQIRASSDQHAAGVDQIAVAITAIRDASLQAMDNTKRTEQQAKMLRDVAHKLNDMLRNNYQMQKDGENA